MLSSSCILLSTCTHELGEKHQAASCALQLLLKRTLLLTLMVSGRILNTACNCLQLCSRYCCIADADAGICKCNGVRLNVCCRWSPLSSSMHTQEWLACLNKVRIKGILALHSCLVSSMPTCVITQKLCSKVHDTVCATAVFQSVTRLCLYNEKHCHTSAALWMSVILL